jgi:hypothetical protein
VIQARTSYAVPQGGIASAFAFGDSGLGSVLSMSSAASTLSNVVSSGSGLATSAVGGAASAASLAAAGVTAGLAIAGVGITAWIQSARLRGGQKIASTNIANDIERKLQDLKASYEASSKSYADWQYAKTLENQLFDLLVQGCGRQELGSAGQRCIEERLCREGEGCKYPWKTWYDVGPAPEGASSGSGSDSFGNTVNQALGPVAQQLGVSPAVLLAGGLVLVGVVLMSMSGKGGSW